MLQPKNLKKNKISLTKNFYLADLIVLFFIIIFSLIIGWFSIPDTLKFKNIIAIILIFSLILLSLPLLIFIPSQNSRVWLILWRFLKFHSENKEYKAKSKNKNTKYLNIYKSIDKNCIVKLKSNFYIKEQYIKIFEFKGKNIWIQTLNDRKVFLKQVLNFLNILETKISFVKKNEINNYESKIEEHKNVLNDFLEENIEELSVEKKTKFQYLYNSKIDFENLQNKEKNDLYYVVIYGKNLDEIHEITSFLETQFANLDLKIKELSINDTIIFLKTNFQLFDSVEDKDQFLNKINENQKEKIDLDNYLEIEKINFKKQYLKIDNKFITINTISEYALDLNFGWADTFFNSDSDLIIWHLDPINTNDYEKILDKADNKIKTSLAFNKKSIYRNKKDIKYIEAIDEIMHLVNVENQKLFNCSLFFVNFDKDFNNLKKRLDKNLYKNIKLEKSKVNKLYFRQAEALLALNFSQNNNFSESIEMVSRNIAYGWPFTFENTHDSFSFFLGNSGKRNVVLDIWKRDWTHTNSNCIFFGLSGKGKTTAIKKLILDSYLKRNASTIIIDPQREYQDFANILDVNWIDLGTGTTKINPLEIQIPSDNQLISDFNVLLINHINKIIEWFSIIYPKISEEQKTILILGLKETYKKFNFLNLKNWDKITHKSFPIISDLIKTIKNISWKNEEKFIYFNESIKLINYLKINFENYGPYANNYNNYTNIDFDKNFTIIDIKTITDNASVQQINATVFLILFFIQNKINDNFYNKNQKTLLVIDEVHKFIDENNLNTLNFIFQTTKTIRKFHGSILLSTQNPSDFALNKQLINKTHGILKNMQYKFFFNLPGEDIAIINKIFDSKGYEKQESQMINKIDEEFLIKAMRGQILLLTSKNQKIHLRIYYNNYEKQLFFKERE